MKKWLIALSLILAACSQQTSDVSDYLSRLENVLERDAENIATNAKPEFPRLRQLRLEQPSAELSIREFLSLRQCTKLHSVIAQRNSQLGKVASASQKLFSDLEILDLGPACGEQLSDPSLAKKLSRFIEQKETNLNVVLWHALLGQAEHASFWHNKNNDTNYPIELSLDVSSDIAALESFSSRVLSGERRFSTQQTDQIERHLGRLRGGDGGRLLDEYWQLVSGLKRADSVIEQRLKSPLCLVERPTQKAHYFANVINARFIKNVQTHSVRLNQRANKLLSSYYRFEKPLLQFSTDSYKAWAKSRNAVLTEGQSSVKTHVMLLQKLYKQCGLTPGAQY